MGDVDNQDAYEHLRQELLAFGETVGKITEKNQPILEKKLNHLRARKRMSEKLSQSMLIEKSPSNKAGRGRGKKRTKKEPDDVDSTSSAVNDAEVHSSSSKVFIETVKEPVAAVVPEPEVLNSVTSQQRSLKSAVTNRRKTIVLENQAAIVQTVAPVPSKSAVSAVSVGSIAAEPLRVTDESLESNKNTKARGQKRGRKTISVVEESVKVCNEPPTQGCKDLPGLKGVSERCAVTQPVTDASLPPTKVDESRATAGSASRIPKYTVSKGTHTGKKSEVLTNAGHLSDKVQSNCSSTAQLLASDSASGQTSVVEPLQTPLIAQIIDSTLGVLAADAPVRFDYCSSSKTSWKTVWNGQTDANGKCSLDILQTGTYRLHADSGLYFQRNKRQCCYPYVDVTFHVDETTKPSGIHIALSQFGYSTHFVK